LLVFSVSPDEREETDLCDDCEDPLVFASMIWKVTFFKIPFFGVERFSGDVRSPAQLVDDGDMDC